MIKIIRRTDKKLCSQKFNQVVQEVQVVLEVLEDSLSSNNDNQSAQQVQTLS